MLTDSLSRIMMLYTIWYAPIPWVGMYLSFLVDVASRASIVLTGAVLFVVSIVVPSFRLRAMRRAGKQAADVLLPLAPAGELFE